MSATDSRSYRALGVSATKGDVLAAASLHGDGLYPGAFCKVVDDVLTGDPHHCLALHADGAGTKALVAYLVFRETGDESVFATLAQDALAMNVDDLLCIGARGPFVVTNTIARHRGLIPGGVVESIVAGYRRCADVLGELGVDVLLCGGETEDVGDIVRTLVVDAAVACRLRRDEVIDGRGVKPGDVIVGLSSTGRSPWEDVENSGIGSNGLTLARHVLLAPVYRERFPESAAPDLDAELSYRGRYLLSDRPERLAGTLAEALLSPTRTYAPVVVKLLSDLRSGVHGVVHCTGGGQTKCLRLGPGIRYVKDGLFEVPALFGLIQDSADLPWTEMFQVFNMGHRMELYVDAGAAGEVVHVARSMGVDARPVGRCEPWVTGPRLVIEGPGGHLTY